MEKLNLKNIPEDFYWLNEPNNYCCDGKLVLHTESGTDFWQRTHYGFRMDNGHCLLTSVEGNFSFTAHVESWPSELYDQAGVFLRIDAENWIKVSIEYEGRDTSKLGSVVTNLGYSDWASTDIPADLTSMWYRLSRKDQDFLIENSSDGVRWSQMRVAYLHKSTETIGVGIYACSPKEGSFRAEFDEICLRVC